MVLKYIWCVFILLLLEASFLMYAFCCQDFQSKKCNHNGYSDVLLFVRNFHTYMAGEMGSFRHWCYHRILRSTTRWEWQIASNNTLPLWFRHSLLCINCLLWKNFLHRKHNISKVWKQKNGNTYQKSQLPELQISSAEFRIQMKNLQHQTQFTEVTQE